MEALEQLAQNAANLNEAWLWRVVLADEELVQKILDLNRIGQLYEKGIDSTGRSLKDIGGSHLTDSGYAPFTIQVKSEKGQRTDHITLKDTGEFYQSFYLIIDDEAFFIEADPLKDGGTNLLVEWGEDILGLTPENVEIVADFFREQIAPLVLEALLS